MAHTIPKVFYPVHLVTEEGVTVTSKMLMDALSKFRVELKRNRTLLIQDRLRKALEHKRSLRPKRQFQSATNFCQLTDRPLLKQ